MRFKHIPPTQFLKGFDAAARLESFSRAATEIGLTQSAISHQMKLLEAQIGQPLFLRIGREVRLTDAGRDYHRTVRQCLETLEEGYRRLEPYRKPGSIVIYVPQDFARRWLLPRLTSLKRTLPDCEPWLDTSGVTVDFESMELDIAITLAAEPSDGCEHLLIARNRLTPVATPELAARFFAPANLLEAPLLHDEGPVGWSDWLADMGIDSGAAWKGINFSDSDMALAAAEMGYGVALSSTLLAEGAIVAGTLNAPFSTAIEDGRGWYALTRPDRLEDRDVRAVWDWMQMQAVLPKCD